MQEIYRYGTLGKRRGIVRGRHVERKGKRRRYREYNSNGDFGSKRRPRPQSQS